MSESQPQAPTWVCVQTLTGHRSWVRSVAISPDGQFLASLISSLLANTSREVVFEATNSTFQNPPFRKMWVWFLESRVVNNSSKISKDNETDFPEWANLWIGFAQPGD
jgi:WD40 repeat protein